MAFVKLQRRPVLKVGELAPDFTLSTADGTRFTLSEARGRHVLVAFLPCNWCGTCSIRVRSYEREATQLERFGILGVIVSVPGAQDAERFARALGLDPLVLVDEDGSVTRSFASAVSASRRDADARPAAVLVDRDGKVLYASRCDEPGAFVEPQQLVSVLEASAVRGPSGTPGAPVD